MVLSGLYPSRVVTAICSNFENGTITQFDVTAFLFSYCFRNEVVNGDDKTVLALIIFRGCDDVFDCSVSEK
jgi:hypothetical protein